MLQARQPSWLARPDIVDQFGRNSASGWGTADTGQAWAISGGSASDYSVGSGVGTVDNTSVNVNRFTIGTMSASTDLDATLDVRCPETPSGASMTASLMVRVADVDNAYIIQCSFGTTGVLTASLRRRLTATETSLGTVATINGFSTSAFYRMRVRCIGSTIQGKVWLATDPEPASWGQSVVDTSVAAGNALRTRTFRTTGNTSTDTRMLYDNFSCRALYPNVRDSFSRTVGAGGWGAADSGHGWIGTGTASHLSVSGGLGRINIATAGLSNSTNLDFVHTDVDCTFDIGAAQVVTGGALVAGAMVRCDVARSNYYMLQAAFRSTGQVDFDIIRNAGGATNLANDFVVLSYTPGEMFRGRIQCIGSTIRAKVWRAASSEPAAWAVTLTDSVVGAGLRTAFNCFRDGTNTSVDPTVLFDNFFVRPLRPAINDAFGRTVASGWGNLTSGQAWVNSDTALMAVAGSRGEITPAGNTAQCAALAAPAADVGVRATVDIAQTQTGATTATRIMARATASTTNPDRYEVQASFDTSGNVTVLLRKVISSSATTLATLLPSTAYAAGTGIRVQLRCIGSKIMGKAWIVGQSEPAWSEVQDTSLVSAGFVQCNTLRGNGSTTPNARTFYDDFLVVDLSRPLRVDTSQTGIDPSRLVAA